MMEQMRRNMPLILWILVIAFLATIVFSWGMGGFERKQKPGIAGVIEDKEITNEFYEQLIQRRATEFAQQNGVEPAEQNLLEIRKNIWDDLVREILITKEAERLGIQVTDEEVVDQVRNNPPDFIVGNEAFQTDGQFDINKYYGFLRNPAYKDQVIYLEQNYRQSMRERKLISRVVGSVEVTDWELRQRFEERNVSGKAKYLYFIADSMKVDSSAVTEAEIEKYYKAHLKDNFVAEERRIAFVRFELETSSEDSAHLFETANDIKIRLDEGEDFGFLAMTYSEHHTAQDSGKLDWMPKGQLETVSDSAVWKTPVGKITGPLITRYGIHFYLVEDRKRIDGELKTKCRILQLQFSPSSDSKEALQNRAQNFAEEIKKADFNEVAQAYDIKVDTSGYFSSDNIFIPKIGKVKSMVDFAFNNRLNSTSEIYPFQDDWLVFKVINIQNEHYKSKADTRTEIFDKLFKEEKMKQAQVECEKFYSSLSDKSLWEKKAIEAGLTVRTTPNPFRYSDFIPDVGRDINFTVNLFRAEVGQVVGPVAGRNGYFILQLTEKVPIDTMEFHLGKRENIPKLLEKKQELAYNDWFEQLKKKAKIKDYRYLYYRML
jgi:parvulin-like peptidyl-prolyl isomerase